MSKWPSSKAGKVLAAPVQIGWVVKRTTGSHRTLARPGWPNYVFAFHAGDEIGPAMLARIAKQTGLSPADLWHRVGFGWWWRWKSARGTGRPPEDAKLRALIVKLANDNPTWGAPRIHGELLKLGFSLAQSTVSKYLPRRRRPPDEAMRQRWRTFLANHLPQAAGIDFFVFPTLTELSRAPSAARRLSGSRTSAGSTTATNDAHSRHSISSSGSRPNDSGRSSCFLLSGRPALRAGDRRGIVPVPSNRGLPPMPAVTPTSLFVSGSPFRKGQGLLSSVRIQRRGFVAWGSCRRRELVWHACRRDLPRRPSARRPAWEFSGDRV